MAIQWTLANPNSLGPEPIQISEIFGLMKATAATCVIVTAPYLHSVLGSLGSVPLLLHVPRTQNTDKGWNIVNSYSRAIGKLVRGYERK